MPAAISARPGGEPAIPAELSARAAFTDGWTIAAHPGLTLTHARRNERELLCLGTILDPRSPSLGDAELVTRLLEAGSFSELEAALYRLGGRWLLFVQLAGERRIYHDAAGLRACFYTASEHGVVAASQPRLIADLLGISPEREPRQGLADSAFADVYPITLTPFPGVRQLHPNHYLDLTRGASQRYWPTASVPERSLDEAARAIAELLQGSVQALSQRGRRLALPLTGGYDSRTLLAASWAQRRDMDSITVVDVASPAHDIVLPFRLARACALKHSFVWGEDATPEQLELAIFNTGGVWRDPNELRVAAFGRLGDDLAMFANVSEVIRCGFFEQGDYPSQVDPALLARVSGWQGDAVALTAYTEWFEAAPRHTNLLLLDLFFWEACIGGWSAMDCLATDGFVEVASPYNCRELLALGLGVPATERRLVPGKPEQSCLLHRAICRAAAPETLSVPFNDGWLGGVVPLLRRMLPPAMRGLLKRLRMKARELARLAVFLVEPLTGQLSDAQFELAMLRPLAELSLPSSEPRA